MASLCRFGSCGFGFWRTGKIQSGTLAAWGEPGTAYQLFLALLAGGVTRVACRFTFGLQRCLAGRRFFLFAGEFGGGLRGGLFLAALGFGLFGLARGFCLRPRRCKRFALGLACLYRGIIGTRLGTKLVQDGFPGFQSGLLAVREARFLESTHR